MIRTLRQPWGLQFNCRLTICKQLSYALYQVVLCCVRAVAGIVKPRQLPRQKKWSSLIRGYASTREIKKSWQFFFISLSSKKKLYNFTKYSLLYIYLKLLTLGNDHYNYPKLYIQKLIILKCNDLNLLSILVCLFNIPSKARPKWFDYYNRGLLFCTWSIVFFRNSWERF